MKALSSDGKRCRKAARWQEHPHERAGLSLINENHVRGTFGTYRQPSMEMDRRKGGLSCFTESTGTAKQCLQVAPWAEESWGWGFEAAFLQEESKPAGVSGPWLSV